MIDVASAISAFPAGEGGEGEEENKK